MSKLCLITGASGGIGLEFAKIFARKKYDLILVARNEKKLKDIAKSLKDLEGIDIITISADLSKTGDAKKVYEKVKAKKLIITDLVNNAGFGSFGEFKKLKIDDELNMIDLNVKSLVELTHLFLKDIIKQKGRILNVASTAAFQPIPKMATYAATKSFVVSFSQAINVELKNHGASCTTLCPGPTKTNFDLRAGMQKTKLFSGPQVMAADDVAQIGYDAMIKRKSIEISGGQNKALSVLTKLVPSSISANIAKEFVKDKK